MNSLRSHSHGAAAAISQRRIYSRHAAIFMRSTIARAFCCAGIAAALVVPVQAADEAAASRTANPTDGSAFDVVDASASTSASKMPGKQESLQKVGEARLRVLLWSVYTSRLYTPTGTYTESERPLRLEIEYLINVESTALVDRTAREWDAMGRQHPRQDEWLQRLDTLWPDIDKKDVLTLEVDENDVSTFYHNGEQLGRIEDPAFGEHFLDIWLSEDSTRPSLREELIGMTVVN